MLGPEDVGYRVVIRRVVGLRDGRPLSSDALGELVALTDTDATVRTNDGTVTIPLDTVARAKRVPPGARDIVRLERAAAEAWPAPDTAMLGGWLLRAGEGWTSRANSALALGRGDIDATVAWYAERGLTPRITTPLPVSTPTARRLRTAGWISQPTVLVQTAALASDGGDGVDLAAEPSAEWLATVAGRKGTLPEAARHILTAVGEVTFASVYDERGLIGIARGTVTRGWLGISLVEVAERARRHGVARRMTYQLIDWGRSAGADRAYLQVEAHNAAAVALYAGLGFTTHHTYVTWSAPPEPAG